jgi:hypothetical protein
MALVQWLQRARKPRRALSCRPVVERLEDRDVPSRVPVVIVPGQPASLPVGADNPLTAPGALARFSFNLGYKPQDLTATFSLKALGVNQPYRALFNSFVARGYKPGVDLFMAAHDWRMPVAPLDGVDDGFLSKATAALVTQNKTYRFGVQYLGYYLKQASAAWERNNPGQPLPGIDVVSHSEGYLLTRAYISSPAYGGSYVDASGKSAQLPRILHHVSLAGPNEGASEVFNWWVNNYVGQTGSSLAEGGLYNILQPVFFGVANFNAVVNGPDGKPQITRASVTNRRTGRPDPLLFLRQYIPSLNSELPTYNFLDGKNINNNPELRNNLLLDLNAGPRNGWLDRVGQVSAVFGVGLPTPTTATSFRTPGPVLPVTGNLDTLTQEFVFGSITTRPGELRYQDNLMRGGDTQVPLPSLVSTFANDRRIKIRRLPGLTHSTLLTTPSAQRLIVSILNTPVAARP